MMTPLCNTIVTSSPRSFAQFGHVMRGVFSLFWQKETAAFNRVGKWVAVIDDSVNQLREETE